MPTRSSRWFVASSVAVLGVLAFAPPACAAESVYVSPGFVVSRWTGLSTGLGGELSMTYLPRGLDRWAGGFVQAEALLTPVEGERALETSFRGSLGPQFGLGPLGVELGLDYRSGRGVAQEARSLGLRVAPFVSFGVVYASCSLAFLPAQLEAGRDLRPVGLAAGVTFGVKVPVSARGGILGKDLCPHC